jgi:hypothetical protein
LPAPLSESILMSWSHSKYLPPSLDPTRHIETPSFPLPSKREPNQELIPGQPHCGPICNPIPSGCADTLTILELLAPEPPFHNRVQLPSIPLEDRRRPISPRPCRPWDLSQPRIESRRALNDPSPSPASSPEPVIP